MRFKRVYVEISNICNLNCSFCSPLKREKRSMTIPEFEYIIEKIKPFTSFIYFHVKGEPLLHPNLEEFLDIAHKNGMQVNITTNGTLLKNKRELLLSHPAVRQVNISLHSLKEHEQKDYVKTAVDFSYDANHAGKFVVLRLWNLSKEGETDSLSLEAMKQIEKKYHPEIPLEISMGGHKSVKLAPFSFIGWEEEFEWPATENAFYSEDGYCYGMKHQIAILADGTVVPCCLDANGEEPLGNVFKEEFSDIINSKKAKTILHGFNDFKAKAELCRHCSFRTRFDKYIKR